jgi:hypothetical protein
MWVTKLFTALIVILAGLLPSSCTTGKKPMAQQHAPQTAPVATVAAAAETKTNKIELQNNENLGELELTNHYETCVNLGAGNSCTIKPTLLDNNNLKLTMAFETKNASGGMKGLSILQVVTKSGQPFEVAVGDMNLTLTPKLVTE